MKVPLDVMPVKAPDAEEIPDLVVDEDDEDVIVTGRHFKMTFGKSAGTITYLEYFGNPLFESRKVPQTGGGSFIMGRPQAPAEPQPVQYSSIGGPLVNLYRAPIDNERRRRGGSSGAMQLWNLAHVVTGFEIQQLHDKIVEIKADLKSTEPSGYSVTSSSTYTIYGNGRIDVQTTFIPDTGISALPKLGFILSLNKGFENIEYFGAGPFENYVDRKSAAFIGRYRTTVDDMFVPYIRPQDCGNRTDVRWFTITNHNGYGLLVSAPDLMDFSALHYTPVDLDIANHPYELTRREETILAIDHAVTGLGNGSVGPGTLEQYQVKPVKATFKYSIRPYADMLGDRAEVAK